MYLFLNLLFYYLLFRFVYFIILSLCLSQYYSLGWRGHCTSQIICKYYIISLSWNESKYRTGKLFLIRSMFWLSEREYRLMIKCGLKVTQVHIWLSTCYIIVWFFMNLLKLIQSNIVSYDWLIDCHGGFVM